MPLYEYQCDNCHEVFEVIEKFSDEPLKVHAKCGGGPVHRLLSAPALQFKGSGWYVTDYAKGGSSASSGKSASSDGTSGDSKKSSDSSKSGDSSSNSSTTGSPSTSTSDKK